ncbi:Cloroperoxidase [Athelia psychrophila]|uniref:Cloroperoxidase n=1 Tax=Athelia psychrophila TaxID=1759441 RepID=A0A166RN38_9AGAM|nr:Cloroperoxidase [Fibularhizoctonia sp. CBS 109695]
MSFLHSVQQTAFNIYTFSKDAALTVLNIVTPSLPEGKVVPKGHPGFKGEWPEYVPSKEGDSRCSCPMLNAMANHGILPHDGKNIKFTEMTKTVRTTTNFASTFCLYVPKFAAEFLKKNYYKDTFDLAELDLHNAIEHDGSLGTISVPLIEQLLAHSSAKDQAGRTIMTKPDLTAALKQRFADSKATNPDFTTSMPHKMFGASNASAMLSIFGGRVEDLRTFLLEERIPEGWEPGLRSRFGLTFAVFNMTAFSIVRGMDGWETHAPSANAAELSGAPARLDRAGAASA